MLSIVYLYFVTLSLIVFSYQKPQSVTCGYEFNTLDYREEYKGVTNAPVGIPVVNCVDLTHNQFTCVKSTCKNWLGNNPDLKFKDCVEPSTNRHVDLPRILAYRYLSTCSQIDIFESPHQDRPDWWCPKNAWKNLNTGLITCGSCLFNATIKPVKENCHK
ncbi:hypothetical protein O181_033150 [Austropuccinia psidii MF-1]|uniref:Uncharacterized protein n=1 Tax=Austropuccinia psidii MF-1 TaxID=1389203 RepID=A0A9Q3H8Y0_9BASI|nr:hypothetical protein [Austropuccinia psidii MF-1]